MFHSHKYQLEIQWTGCPLYYQQFYKYLILLQLFELPLALKREGNRTFPEGISNNCECEYHSSPTLYVIISSLRSHTKIARGIATDILSFQQNYHGKQNHYQTI